MTDHPFDRESQTLTIQVPGYSIQKLIGEGGMASVYLAKQDSLDRLVALKILKKFDTDAQVQRFFNEGKIIASLEHHNIITIHDLGEVNGRCFLAMEYLEGDDLKQRVDAGLAPDEALQMITVIANCLAFVHRKDIIHRDIKPENILFRSDGSAVVTDFGVAKQLQTDTSLTMDGSAIGSPHYISPEQAEQKPLDPRTDIYSLGIIFYEMLTGQKPFQGDSPIEIIIAHLTTEAAPLPPKFTRYQALVDRMIAKDPDERFESAIALTDYLATLRHSNSNSKPIFSNPLNKIDPEEKALADSRQNQPKQAIHTQKVFNKTSALGLALSLILAACVYFYLPKQPPTNKALSGTTAVAASDLTTIDQQNIHRLLAEAEGILADERLTLPSLRRAYAIFDTVLKEEPMNADALQGINRVKSLDGKIHDEIDRNLNEADKALHAYRLTSPVNNNAMFYFEQILILDPNNPEAKQGKFRVASVYADLVEANLKDFEYSKAKTNLNKGLSLNPASPRLLALKEQTNAFTDAPKRLFGKVTSIFD